MPRTSRALQVFPIVLRRVSVARVRDLTPNMRRITLTGEELLEGRMGEGFERPPFRSLGFDDHVKLVVPPAEEPLPHIGTQEAHRFAWNPEVFAFTRDYTVRAWDREANTFDVDVVRHDHGLASDWAFRAEPGDEIHFAGPKSSALHQDEADWHLLVGDETALPAIGRWLETAPAGTRGRVIVEVPDEADRQQIHTAADVAIEWLVRGGAPAGTGTLLLEAVRRTALPEGRVYAWCGGETKTIAPIRRHLRRDRALPKEDVEVVGYWRRHETARDEAPADVAANDDAERIAPAANGRDEDVRSLLHELHEMSELGPPIVTRAAATLGVGPLIASGTATLAGLSAATGVDAGRLRALLDAMTALGLLEADAGEYRNTALGGLLLESETIDRLSLHDPANRAALALVDLVDVLRTGRPGGADWRARRAADPALEAAYQDRSADALYYVLEPLGRLDPVARASTLAVFGDAAAETAARLARGRTVHLPGSDPAAAWPEHDCAILVSALEGRSDAEALALLRAALASGPALVLAEHTADKAAVDDHAAEYALTSLALTGSPLRGRDGIGALLREAGAASVEHTVLGWGFGPYGNVTVAHA
ncbi:MAG TPA: siderophore-interacting protein [Glycomyces sp.]|nr:siderophore-interacting protein [Glycomyces sp.]